MSRPGRWRPAGSRLWSRPRRAGALDSGLMMTVPRRIFRPAPPPPCTPTKLSAGWSGVEACRTVAERDGGIVLGTPRSAPLLLPIDAGIDDADDALRVRVPLSGAAEMEKASTTPREEDRKSAAATPREEHAMVLLGRRFLAGWGGQQWAAEPRARVREVICKSADLVFDGADALTGSVRRPSSSRPARPVRFSDYPPNRGARRRAR